MKITISGLAASGKGTVARAFARIQGIAYVDIGLLFRLVAYGCHKKYFDISNLVEALETGELVYRWDTDNATAILQGCEVTEILRSDRVAMLTSYLASSPEALFLLEEFADMVLARYQNVICDGRNAGTTILKTADFKFYATSPLCVRSERRQRDYLIQGRGVSLQEVTSAIRKRDSLDENRDYHPSIVPEGVIVIETDKMSVRECVFFMSKVVAQ